MHDPRRYLTPDVTADFFTAQVEERAPNRVAVFGAGGSVRPEKLKVTVGFEGGFLAEAGISYAGPNAQGRGRLAAEIVAERMRTVHGVETPVRVDLIGMSALFATAGTPPTDTQDVRLRAALRSRNREEAELLLWEVELLLCCGPAGGGGFRGTITPSIVTRSVLVARNDVRPTLRMYTA